MKSEKVRLIFAYGENPHSITLKLLHLRVRDEMNKANTSSLFTLTYNLALVPPLTIGRKLIYGVDSGLDLTADTPPKQVFGSKKKILASGGKENANVRRNCRYAHKNKKCQQR